MTTNGSRTTGFIGLGAMGTPMAWNLDEADVLSAVYNRTRSKTAPLCRRWLFGR